jgi:hypothetical protein
VPKRVSLRWWTRWTLYLKARASRQLREQWRDNAGKVKFSDAENELFTWAMVKDTY